MDDHEIVRRIEALLREGKSDSWIGLQIRLLIEIRDSGAVIEVPDSPDDN